MYPCVPFSGARNAVFAKFWNRAMQVESFKTYSEPCLPLLNIVGESPHLLVLLIEIGRQLCLTAHGLCVGGFKVHIIYLSSCCRRPMCCGGIGTPMENSTQAQRTEGSLYGHELHNIYGADRGIV